MNAEAKEGDPTLGEDDGSFPFPFLSTACSFGSTSLRAIRVSIAKVMT